ncbi:YjiH family protein [Bacillus sp. JJ1532]|uniref:YjiH family protein n=1 Tax=unclassified Bacillus (in: firmicutes) TaxID=185979 RepID=UPI002FFFAC80
MSNPNIQSNVQTQTQLSTPVNVLKFFAFSLIGIFTFFIPITVNGVSSIPLDHLMSWIRSALPSLVPIYTLIVIFIGAAYPFIKGFWRGNTYNTIFSLLKIVGAVVALMYILNIGPSWLLDQKPLLFDKLGIMVALIVPLGSIFLAFLVGYGLLEFIGVLAQPIMRPIYKTPGRSAVDAVASFVGSFLVGMVITNRLYKEGKYTLKEAAIIVTGFSTVTVGFMIIIANTLEIMHLWNLYFWVTFLVTFLVTAITVRIWPLNKFSNEYYEGKGQPEEVYKGKLLANAWKAGMESANNSLSIGKNVWLYLREGFIMTMSTLPTILSIGLLGMLIATYTPIFDFIGYIFYPLTLILQIPEPLLAAKALAIEITEMYLPALLVVEAPLVTKFIIAVVSVTAIVFFSAYIPSVLSTDIPISIRKLLVIWIERTVLSVIIVTPLAFLLL